MAELKKDNGHSFLERLVWISFFLLLIAGFIDSLAQYLGVVLPFVGVVGFIVNTPFFFVSGLIVSFTGTELYATALILQLIILILMTYRIRKLF